MSTPTIIVDEHHEAYVAWHFFREKNIIAKEGNYLLHIDHHDDMVCGGYDWDFSNLPQTASEARQMLDAALGIADFIYPALYQKIFSAVHILKNINPAQLLKKELYVGLKPPGELFSGGYIPFIHGPLKRDPESRYSFFTRIDGGLSPEDDLSAESLVLDVDLDYFCWDDSLTSVPVKRMEITKAAYEEYMADKNHPFRILPRRLIIPKEQDGKYYLVYEEHFAPKKPAEEETIIRRMDNLFDYLEKAKVTPKAIDVCRSSYSGYLPKERAAFVEKEFMARLNRRWSPTGVYILGI